MPFLFEWKLALGLPPAGRDVPERWSDLPVCPLSPTARHVARVLSEHMDGDGDKCRPGGELIARESGYRLSTVWKAIAELEASGFIRRYATSHTAGKGGRDHPNLYVPTIPGTVRESDAFQALTVRRSTKNRPFDSQKQSGKRTGGSRGLQEDDRGGAMNGAPPAVMTECMRCGTFDAATETSDGELLCAACQTTAAVA